MAKAVLSSEMDVSWEPVEQGDMTGVLLGYEVRACNGNERYETEIGESSKENSPRLREVKGKSILFPKMENNSWTARGSNRASTTAHKRD